MLVMWSQSFMESLQDYLHFSSHQKPDSSVLQWLMVHKATEISILADFGALFVQES